MIYDEKPYVSEKQQEDYNLLVKMSDAIKCELNNKRNDVIKTLINENMTASKKKFILKEFVKSRIYFENQVISIDEKDYLYSELYGLAEKLFDDKSFFGNESSYVINGLTYYENNILFEDLIIAYHNYCLDHEEENLWWLCLLLSRYIYNVLSMESKSKDISFKISNCYDELECLAEYVIGFWNQHLNFYEDKTNILFDDNKRNFFEKIDFDAGYYFAVEDANTEEERKLITAEYASNLIRSCSKSIYLLMATIKEINDSNKYFSKVLKKLRNVVIDMCDNLYFENEDWFSILQEDKRLNSVQLRCIEKDNEIKLLKYTLVTSLEKLEGYDAKTTLSHRLDSLETVRSLDSEELVEEFVKEFSKKLIQTIPENNLDSYYERLKNELDNKYNLLPDLAKDTLASAEYLYDMFVRKKAPEGFDYSGIAVLYFQAFETTYSKIIIEVYSDWLKTRDIDKIFKERNEINKKRFNERTSEEKNRMKDINKSLEKYFTKSFNLDLFFDKRKGELVKTLEIGKFYRFIDLYNCIDEKGNNQATQLIMFLEKNCFKKAINKQSLNEFVKAVKNATIPRNKAAHGLHGLDETDVRKDKILVYDESNIKDILDFKNLLYALLELFD